MTSPASAPSVPPDALANRSIRRSRITGSGPVVRYRPAVRRRIDAGTLLLLTPLLWGATFPATKIALRYLPVPTFMAWSRVLGFMAVLTMVPLLRRADQGRGRRLRD